MATKVSIPYLKNLCKENKIKNYSKLKKDEIIDLLKKNKIEINDPKRKEGIEELTEDLKELDVKDVKDHFIKEVSKNLVESYELDDKMKDPITKYYTFKDDKSEKFWEIKYENDDKELLKFIVRYGKIGTPGSRSKPKMEKLSNINKLIQTKINKGYSEE